MLWDDDLATTAALGTTDARSDISTFNEYVLRDCDFDDFILEAKVAPDNYDYS